MGLLGSQAVLEKSPILNYEQLFSSVSSIFHGQKSCFLGPTIFEIPQPN
jgi:hypothetical protein